MIATQKPTTAAPEAGAVQVEQIDRDAAAAVWEAQEGHRAFADNFQAGQIDGHPLVQAFARHRLAAQAQPTPRGESGARNRDALCRLIEGGIKTFNPDTGLPDGGEVESLADAILALPELSTPIPTGEGLREALHEAKRQLIYMDERSPSGTTPAVIARIDSALAMGGGS